LTSAAQRVIDIARFWPSVEPVNIRQRKALHKLLDDWDGLMTTRKWAAINGVSADTAQRDIADLVARGVLVPNEKGGRSTGYILAGRLGAPAGGGVTEDRDRQQPGLLLGDGRMFDGFLQVLGLLARAHADLIELRQVLFRLVDLAQLNEQFSLVF
jgi:hypothetical protein